MRKKISDKARLLHILDAICEIESYVENCDFKIFESTSVIKHASFRQLEVIGEAANPISEGI